MQGANIPKNDKKHIQNNVQASDVTFNQTKNMQNSAQDANVKNNQTLHIQNRTQGTTLTKKMLQNPFKMVRAALRYQNSA